MISRCYFNFRFICCICRKELSFQKIVTIKSCGDVMCRSCFELVCRKDMQCSNCNKPIKNDDVITLMESGSGYSLHNSVETQKLNPYFKC
jgi:nitric oxide synthase-interacting protein